MCMCGVRACSHPDRMLCFVAALGITVFHYQSPVILVVIAIGWVAVTCLTLWPVWWGKLSIAPRSAPSNQGRQIV